MRLVRTLCVAPGWGWPRKALPAAMALSGLLVIGSSTAVLAAGAKPQIESISVSRVTERGAELQARVNPEGSSTKYAFFLEYKLCQGEGACNMLWKQTEVGSGTIPAGKATVTVSAQLHLSPGCEYEYHVEATNAAGRSHTGEMPGESAHEFVTKHGSALPEPHYCEAS
jgi:hypothetical protein